MLADFPVTIDYTQLVVEAGDHPAPGLLWTQDHVAQGFAWSEQLVSFGVPDHDGDARIQVELSATATLDPQALWAVQVPFRVTGPLRIGNIFNPTPVAVPRGNYIVTCQGFADPPGACLLRLSFTPDDAPGFRILKRGGDITADQVLRRDAEPAFPAGQ